MKKRKTKKKIPITTWRMVHKRLGKRLADRIEREMVWNASL